MPDDAAPASTQAKDITMRLPGRSLFRLLPGLLLGLALLCGPPAATALAEPWDLAEQPRDDPLPRSARFPPSARPAGAPAAPDDIPASLGQGVADVLAGRYGAGADRLAAIADRAGDLADVAAYYEGLGRYLDGQPDRARKSLAKLAAHPTTHFLGRSALYLSILCAARLGDHQSTADLAKTWLANPNPFLAPEVWLRAAVAANGLGEAAKCQDFLRHLSLFAPWSKAAKAGDALARSLCGKKEGDGSACYDPDTPGNILLRAEALAEKGHASAALALLTGLPAGGEAGQVARADYIRGKALYVLRRTKAALAAFARAAAADPTGPLAGWALYHEARCLWRSVNPEDAVRMQALLRQVLDLPGRDDRLREAASRHLALLLTEQGRFPEALAAAESLSGLAVSPDLAAQGASLAALLAFANGDFTKAEAACAAFLERFPRDGWADGARYWRGKALLALSRPAEAATLFRTVVAVRPNTYYGDLAAKRLAELPPATVAAAVAPTERLPRCPDAQQPADPGVTAVLAMAGTLRQADLPQLAELLLRFATRRARKRVDLAMAHIREAEAVGLRLLGVRTAWRTFGGCLLRGSPEALLPLRPYLYPRSHAAAVRAALAGSNVDPDILFALIRQESFFDPRAVSGAGAVGLMQLLPRTARAVGKRLGIRVKRADLFDPKRNIRLGTAFFLERLSRAGNLPSALAGYNAGASRVAVWSKNLGPLGQELFIELIPYTETRNYVRRILANAMMYKRLYAASGR